MTMSTSARGQRAVKGGDVDPVTFEVTLQVFLPGAGLATALTRTAFKASGTSTALDGFKNVCGHDNPKKAEYTNRAANTILKAFFSSLPPG